VDRYQQAVFVSGRGKGTCEAGIVMRSFTNTLLVT
jgi:hypothetical protein